MSAHFLATFHTRQSVIETGAVNYASTARWAFRVDGCRQKPNLSLIENDVRSSCERFLVDFIRLIKRESNFSRLTAVDLAMIRRLRNN